MGALLRIFRRKDAETKKREQETAEKERKAGDRHGRLSKSRLSEWEGKYGANGETTSGSSDDRTLCAPELGKVRSNGSGSTFLSVKQGPVDFLPKLELGGFGGCNEPLVHTPPTPPMPPTAAKRASMLSSRPVLAPLQPAAPAPEWDRYLSSRTLSVAQHQAQSSRASRTLSMFSLSDPAALSAAGRTSSTSPVIQLHLPSDRLGGEDLVVDDDDIPLAVAASIRTRLSPILPRPSTMYDLPASPSLTQQGNYSSPTLPRSHSRAASLSMPAILAQPPLTPPLGASASPVPSPNLASIGKRATLIDLTEPSKVDPYQRRAGQQGGGEERIVLGDRSRAGKKREEKPKSEGPKILDFEELENRHKKRMSMLQTTATDHLTTEAAKKRFQQQQQREAEQQRRKEAESARRRSVSSNLHLAGGVDRTSSRSPRLDDFAAFKAGASSAAVDPRRRSMSGLSALLKFGGNGSSSAPSTPAEASSPAFPPPLSSTRARRQSTLALVQPTPPPRTSTSSGSGSGSGSYGAPTVAAPPAPSSSRTRPPRPTLAGNRRHSLGTLLEASYEASLLAASAGAADDDDDAYGDLEPPARPFAFAPHGWSRGGREPGHEKRVEKVHEWRRRASSEAEHSAGSSRRTSPGSSRNASSSSVASMAAAEKGKGKEPAGKGRGEFGLLEKKAAAATGGGEKKTKKHDWLAY
ncbi:hypothetical protein JCM6882_006673 [Rhodosporidiobolus microsporus]